MERAASPVEEPDRARRIFWLLVVLAIIVRVAYYLEYTTLPFLEAPLFDSLVYLRQAAAVRAGDFAHPTLLAMSPLYGYFLAITGEVAIFVQLALGVAALFIVRRIVERTFEPLTALVACALYLGYGLVMFYETKVLAETLGLFLLLCAFERYSSVGFSTGRFGTCFVTGVVLALAVLARANVLFAAPCFVVAAALPWRRGADRESTRILVRRAAGLALGLALGLGGNGLATHARTGHFVPVIFASRTVTATTGRAWNGSLDAASMEGSPPSAWDVVRQAEERLSGADVAAVPPIDIGGWLAGAPRKLAVTMSDVETTFDYGYYGERDESRSLDLMPVSFGVLVVLGFVGAVLLARDRGARSLLPYAPIVIGVLVTTTLYHPSSRYRLPMVVPLLLLSGHGAVGLARMRGGRKRLLAVASVAILCAVLTYRTVAYELTSPGLWQLRIAEAEAARGDAAEARRRIGLALRTDPDNPSVRERAQYVASTLSGSDHGPGAEGR